MEKEIKFKIAKSFTGKFLKILKNEDELKQKIVDMFGFKLSELKELKNENIIDTYFDTSMFDLKKEKSLLRIREVNKKYILTVKFNSQSNNGVMQREEKNFSIKKREINDLIQTEFDEVITSFFPDLNNSYILEVFMINNKRKTMDIITEDGAKFEIAFDNFSYDCNQTSFSKEKFLGIEVEAKNEQAEQQLELLSQKIASYSTIFHPDTKSKYEKGFDILNVIQQKKYLVCALGEGFVLNLKKVTIIEARNYDEASVLFTEKKGIPGFCVGEIVNGKTIFFFNKIKKAEEICKKISNAITKGY